MEPLSEPIRVVGVVGLGHVPGITRLWAQPQEGFVKAIMAIPPPSLTSRFVKFSCKVSLFTFGGYLVYRFVPVPRILRENVSGVLQKIMSSVKVEPVRFSIH